MGSRQQRWPERLESTSNEMTEKEYLVVGSGISGLSAAILLARKGCAVRVWDESDEVGGLLAPVAFRGIPCDRGSHRVHPESHPLLQELTVSSDWTEQSRQGLLRIGGRNIPYPITARKFLRGLGVRTSMSMAWGFMTRPNRIIQFRQWEKERSEAMVEDIGFQEFVEQRVGLSAYEKFYKPYVQKVWGLDPSQISKTVAKQRVSTSNPLSTLKKSLTGTNKVEKKFLYPKDGLGSMIQQMRNEALELGVQFDWSTKFEAQNDSSKYEAVLYSGHLEDIVPDFDLGHRGIYLLHIAYKKGIVPQNDTWYVPETKYWFGRVSQPSRFSKSLESQECEILCVEIPEGTWGQSKDFISVIDTITEQLLDVGILTEYSEPLEVKQTWIPKVYPMYTRGWVNLWKDALKKTAELGSIYPIGRQGLFLHCNMDHCVHIASEAIQHVLQNGTPKEWSEKCLEFVDVRVRD